jgi:CHAD domain-containing protein
LEATSSLERELKLSAPERFRLPDLSEIGTDLVVSDEDVQRFASVYYDTGDLRLTRWDCGLRFRSSDGWTLKLPAEGTGVTSVRREYRFGGAPGEPPPAALDLLLGVTRGLPLQPVARLRTIRRGVSLRDAAGRLLAVVTNDHVGVLEGGRVVRRFREVEVEFTGHCPAELVEELVERLRRAGTGPAHGVAKHVRALGLEAGVVREVSIPETWPEDPALQAVRLAIARSVSALVRHDAGVRTDEDVEDVHQMRVATRRLRSHLRTLAPLLEADWAEGLLTDLRWLAGELGRVRDADVLAQRLRASASQLAAPDRQIAKDLLDRLVESRRDDRRRLLESLRSQRYLALVDRLVEAARSPRVLPVARGPARAVLLPLVRRRWKRLLKQASGCDAQASAEELHAVRIRAKHARYAAELAEPVFGKPARRLARALRGLQQTLGDYRDAVVAADWLRRASGEVPRETAYVAGVLAAREERLRAEALERWPRAWERAGDRRLREWLRAAPVARGA